MQVRDVTELLSGFQSSIRRVTFRFYGFSHHWGAQFCAKCFVTDGFCTTNMGPAYTIMKVQPLLSLYFSSALKCSLVQ